MAYRKNKRSTYNEAGVLIQKDCPRCNLMLDIECFSVSRHNVDGYCSLCRGCTKKFRLARDNTDARKRLLLSRVKHSAKAQGLPFNLTLDDIVVPTHCPVFNIQLEFGRSTTDKTWRDNSPSLDRIVPSLGYVRGNVIVVSYRVNRIKNDSSVEELCAVAEFYKSVV